MLCLHCQTNNLYIMKKCNFDSDALTVDIFDYVFVEWLCRRGFYSNFVANLPLDEAGSTSSRAAVRGLIAHVLNTPYLTLSDAVLSAFSFDSTPEGPTFWLNVSRKWEHFAKSLSHLI